MSVDRTKDVCQHSSRKEGSCRYLHRWKKVYSTNQVFINLTPEPVKFYSSTSWTFWCTILISTLFENTMYKCHINEDFRKTKVRTINAIVLDQGPR